MSERVPSLSFSRPVLNIGDEQLIRLQHAVTDMQEFEEGEIRRLFGSVPSLRADVLADTEIQHLHRRLRDQGQEVTAERTSRLIAFIGQRLLAGCDAVFKPPTFPLRMRPTPGRRKDQVLTLAHCQQAIDERQKGQAAFYEFYEISPDEYADLWLPNGYATEVHVLRPRNSIQRQVVKLIQTTIVPKHGVLPLFTRLGPLRSRQSH